MKLLEQSLSPIFNREQVFKSGEGAGKSGSFFFFSHDKKYLIKTMFENEFQVMLRILPHYLEHHRRNPDSLLAKIFGVFTVKKAGIKAFHLLLMENSVQVKSKQNLLACFDLKGSTQNRVTKGLITNSTILKDLDFLKFKKRDKKLYTLSPINRLLVRALRRDEYFLRLHGLIDYSLLIAVERNQEKFDQRRVFKARLMSMNLMRGASKLP